MSKTVELRKVVTGLLKTTGREVFYENATNKAKFPYIVYEFDTVDFGNYGRDDIILTVNVWDRGSSSITVETIADNIEKVLNNTNNPTDKVLPTFYITTRRNRRDEDESIRRRELTFSIQNYYIGE